MNGKTQIRLSLAVSLLFLIAGAINIILIFHQLKEANGKTELM